MQSFIVQVVSFYQAWIRPRLFLVYSAVILVFSFGIFFVNYNQPADPFWDENYHIAAAEKYIENKAFFEPHPPLGKLLIALGEVIVNPNANADKTSFVKTDYVGGDNLEEIDFSGYRLFPALLAAVSGYLFFLLLWQLTSNLHLSFWFSSFFLFNNAFVVHFRATMLESSQIFFVLLALLYFFYIQRRYESEDTAIEVHDRQRSFFKRLASLTSFHSNSGKYFWLGLLFGLAASVKINSLVLGLLFIVWLVEEPIWQNIFQQLQQRKTAIKKRLKAIFNNLALILGYGLLSILGFAISFVGIQYVHQALTYDGIAPQTDSIAADSAYAQKLENGRAYNPLLALETSWRWLQFSNEYTEGVPELDVCKDDENGSFPLSWLIGRKSISYRWEKYAVPREEHNPYFAVDSDEQISLSAYNSLEQSEQNKYDLVVRYLYLVPHPLIWLLSLVGIVLALVIVLAQNFFGLQVKRTFAYRNALLFTALFLGYFAAVLSVSRVLYLYHYFLPLIFGVLAFVSIFKFKMEQSQKSQKYHRLAIILALVTLLIFLSFAPFAYYLPLNEAEFMNRNWVEVWGLVNEAK